MGPPSRKRKIRSEDIDSLSLLTKFFVQEVRRLVAPVTTKAQSFYKNLVRDQGSPQAFITMPESTQRGPNSGVKADKKNSEAEGENTKQKDPQFRATVITAKTTDLQEQLFHLASLLSDRHRQKSVIVFCDSSKNRDMLRLAQRTARAARQTADVYFCDDVATKKMQGLRNDNSAISAISHFLPGCESAVPLDKNVLSKACLVPDGLLDSLKHAGNPIVSAHAPDDTEQHESHLAEKTQPLETSQSTSAEVCDNSSIILVNRQVQEALRKKGRSNGIPQHIYKTLFEKLAEPEGKFEPKGRNFWGIDLGRGSHKALFTLTDDKRVAMVYLGTHQEYDRISTDIRHNACEIRERFLSQAFEDVSYVSKNNAVGNLTCQERLFKALAACLPT